MKRYRHNPGRLQSTAAVLSGYNMRYAKNAFYKSLFSAKEYRGIWLGAFAVLVMLLASLGWYVFALSARVGEDYTLDRVEQQIQGLQEEHDNLMVRLSQEKTLDKIGERAASLGLVKADTTAYVALPSSAVASAVSSPRF